MGKGIVRYGFKSGVLPQPRQIVPRLKTFWEKSQEENVNLKFNPPEMTPKGSSSNPPVKQAVTGEAKIAKSAKEPSNEKTTKTGLQEWRRQASEIRRKYFIDAIQTQQRIEENILKARESAFHRSKQRQENLSDAAESEAAKLTLPTIDSMLKGPFIVPRTEEEKELLTLKRQANRKACEMRNQEHKAELLLDLYQKSESFILTEEELNSYIDQNFGVSHINLSGKEHKFELASREVRFMGTSRDSNVANQLLGLSSNRKPGYGEVNQVLNNDVDTQ